MTLVTLKLTDIQVEDRLREELGNIEELAASIRDFGLMHPPVVDGNSRLVAGGRRYAALCLLRDGRVKCDTPKLYEYGEFTLFENLSVAEQKLLELEENIRRKDLTWQERVLGIAQYHKLSRNAASEKGEKWNQQQTGNLLGMTQANISYALPIAKELKDPKSPYWACSSLAEALQLKLKGRLDDANKVLLQRIAARKQAASVKLNEQSSLMGRPLTETESTQVVKTLDKESATKKITKDDIANFYFQGSCLDVLPVLARTHVINHIICDPPYGIDMDFLSSGDKGRENLISRVAEEHQVDANLDLIQEFLKVTYENIAEDGFLCMWYDLDHHEKISTRAKEIGWKVCRWPLTWCKTSPCLNQSSQYNITKATEVCYFMRRSEKSVIKKKQTRNWINAGSDASSSHPFTKPHEVWEYLIETVSTEGQTIVDPFAGEGSALASIFKMKRIPVGIELNEKHIGNGLSYVQEKLNDPFGELIKTTPIL